MSAAKDDGKDTQEQAREKALGIRITVLFKKYFVTRPEGNCQVLFALTKLDELVDEIMQEVQPEIDQLKREAQAYAESVDNVREVLGLEATHYLIIHDEVITALSRARREGMEEAARIAEHWAENSANAQRRYDSEMIASAIRKTAAKEDDHGED